MQAPITLSEQSPNLPAFSPSCRIPLSRPELPNVACVAVNGDAPGGTHNLRDLLPPQPSCEGRHDTLWKEEDGNDEEHRVHRVGEHDGRVAREAARRSDFAQGLDEQRHDRRADDAPGDGSETAERRHDDVLERQEYGEGPGGDIADVERI